jgi:hypothetical protein
MAATSAFVRASAVALAAGAILVGGLLRGTGDGFTATAGEPTVVRSFGALSDQDRREGSLRPPNTAPTVTASRPVGVSANNSRGLGDGFVPVAPRSPRPSGADGDGFEPIHIEPTGAADLPPAKATAWADNAQPAPAPTELPPDPAALPFPPVPLAPAPALEPEPDPAGPPPAGVAEPMFAPSLDSIWPGEVVDGVILCEDCQGSPRELASPWRRLFDFGVDARCGEPGIGEERVPFAQFEVDHSQPISNNRLRVDLAYGLPLPDRSEFFWSRIGSTGPKYAERSVDYQDFRFQMEFAQGGLFSVFTELPLRVLDPEINGNTAGFGDMVVGNRAVMIDGKYWQVTQVLRTHINTGDFQRGLGTGHVSLEPGLVLRYRWNCTTYLHGELKYLTPLGGDPTAAGDVLRYGLSVATVAYETDTFAVLPSLELVGHTFLDGLKTLPPTVPPFAAGPTGGTDPFIGRVVDVDGEDFLSIHSGVRLVLGPRGDLGLCEVGASGGVAPDNDATFDFLGRLEVRWSY